MENFYQQLFAESGKYNKIGSYWERGNQNEIDLVAVNDLKKEAVFAEIKIDPAKINLNAIKNKAKRLENEFRMYNIKVEGLSIEDITRFVRHEEAPLP